MQLRITYPSALGVVRRLDELDAAAAARAAPAVDWGIALAASAFDDSAAEDNSLGVAGAAAGGAEDDVAGGSDGPDADDEEEEDGGEEEEEGGAAGRGGKKKRSRVAPAAAMQQRYLTQVEVEAQVRLLWLREWEVLRRVFLPGVRATGGGAAAAAVSTSQRDSWRAFFLRTIVVTPPRFRPPTRMGETQYEHPQNVYLTQVRQRVREEESVGAARLTSPAPPLTADYQAE